MKGCIANAIFRTFQDRVRDYGAPEQLSADDAKVYKSSKIMNYCRDLYISLWQSEADHQNQNYQENVWETLKNGCNRLLDFTNAPRSWWLLALLLYSFTWNHTVDANLADGTRSPYMVSTGRGDDISSLLCFRFYEPVYALVTDNSSFPSTSKEVRCRWAGISEHVGGPMTWTLVVENQAKSTGKIVTVVCLIVALDCNTSPTLIKFALDVNS